MPTLVDLRGPGSRRPGSGGSGSARRTPAWQPALLERVTERAGRMLARHPQLGDLGLALAVAGAGVLWLSSEGTLNGRQLPFVLALALPLLLRRRHSLLVFACLAAIAAAQWLLAVPQLADAALLVALYGVALRGRVAEVALAFCALEFGAVIAAAKWAPADPVKVWIGLTGLTVASAVLGMAVRQRRALLASLHERAARLELERDQEGRLAAAAERNRIAREMHDIVAHNLSVMIALADGASYAIDSSPQSAAHATGQISATGRDALLEMRRLLGILRDGTTPQLLSPQPRLTELERLAERVRGAGVPVELSVQGDHSALPEGVQLAVFRVAQEAITNTLKHADRPTAVQLALRVERGLVELEVSDTGGAGRPPRGAARAAGRGLMGMRERASAYGGELQAGPRAEGGWCVRMRLDPDGGRR